MPNQMLLVYGFIHQRQMSAGEYVCVFVYRIKMGDRFIAIL